MFRQQGLPTRREDHSRCCGWAQSEVGCHERIVQRYADRGQVQSGALGLESCTDGKGIPVALRSGGAWPLRHQHMLHASDVPEPAAPTRERNDSRSRAQSRGHAG